MPAREQDVEVMKVRDLIEMLQQCDPHDRIKIECDKTWTTYRIDRINQDRSFGTVIHCV